MLVLHVVHEAWVIAPPMSSSVHGLYVSKVINKAYTCSLPSQCPVASGAGHPRCLCSLILRFLCVEILPGHAQASVQLPARSAHRIQTWIDDEKARGGLDPPESAEERRTGETWCRGSGVVGRAPMDLGLRISAPEHAERDSEQESKHEIGLMLHKREHSNSGIYSRRLFRANPPLVSTSESLNCQIVGR